MGMRTSDVYVSFNNINDNAFFSMDDFQFTIIQGKTMSI